jgi:hypothetical protein
MKTTKAILATLIIATVFSCSPSSTLYKSENLSQTGFSQYKTYAFLPTTDTAYTKMFDKPRLESLMSAAAIKQLSKKKMKLDTANPDCFFRYTLIVNRNYDVSQQQHVEYNPDVFTPAFDNDARIYTFSSNNRPVVYAGKLSIDTLREGSLVIDMIDTKQGNVVWRSTFSGKTQETYQQPMPDAVNAIIKNMFKKFPK